MKKKMKHILQRINEGVLSDIWSSTIWVYQYARSYWKNIIFYTVIGLSGSAIAVIISLVSKNLVDIITGYHTGPLIKTFGLFIGLSVANIIIGQISVYLSSRINIQLDNEIKVDIFNKILITDWESLNSYHTGDLLTRWNCDSSVISSSILNWFPNLIVNTFRFLASFIIIMYYDTTFGILALAGLPVSILVSRSLLRRMQSNNKESAAITAKITGFTQETFANIQTIKAFDIIHTYNSKLMLLQKEALDMRLRFQKLSMTTSIIISLIGIVIANVCYGWGIYLVWNGIITYGTMTLFLGLSSSMTGNLNTLISMFPNAISLATSVARLKEILDMPRDNFIDNDKVDQLLNTSKEEGISLSIHNLSFIYPTGTTVFKSCSLVAHPHEVVALKGASGEGKTTLLRILLALLHPQGGECKLYVKDHQDDPLSLSPATRKLFSYVPQGNTMFSGTIAQNMRAIKTDASEEDIMDALRTACAWEFIEKLPEGIHSIIGERGGGLSEGQSQRLAIARALLCKTPILILDEATSALDVATELRVLKGIMQDEYPRTCIITTHRPTVLKMCSRVYGIKDYSCQIISDHEIDSLY
ncbi:MAG: hypothetical protein K0R46_1890 [Herbinix sp.]|nr:hypothetical protein [Herbinix sp.]